MAPMNAEPQPSTYEPRTRLGTNGRRAALMTRRARSSIIQYPRFSPTSFTWMRPLAVCPSMMLHMLQIR